jgi:hypothetical protein
MFPVHRVPYCARATEKPASFPKDTSLPEMEYGKSMGIKDYSIIILRYVPNIGALCGRFNEISK